jgi:hypothetical protein
LSSTSRVAAVLAVAVSALGLAQTAAAATLAVSADVEGAAVSVSADVPAPLAKASVQVSTAAAAPAASASAAVESGPVSVRVAASARPTAAPPPRDRGTAPRSRREARSSPVVLAFVRAPRDRFALASYSSTETVRLAPPKPTQRATVPAPAADISPAQLPDSTVGGWAHSLQAATGSSGSTVALASLVLVLLLLVLRAISGALSPPRPSLHSVALQRPG